MTYVYYRVITAMYGTNHKLLNYSSLSLQEYVSSSAVSKGDPLYEHKKGKQSVTPRDMTGVQYTEI